jgi:putative hydrolase of the HAD superfamily
VLLDLDGTLVDRDAALRTWLRWRAGLAGDAIAGLLELDAGDQRSLAALGLAVDQLRPGLARDPRALSERIRAELPGLIEPDPAVARALASLRSAGLKLALVSNGGPTQRRKLAAAGLPEAWFDAILISGERGYAKPAAAMFEAALAELGVGGPSMATMIGDSPEEDIAGAAGVGVATIWIARGRVYPQGSPSPSRTADDFPAAVAALCGSA